jgi:hypothetical protein
MCPIPLAPLKRGNKSKNFESSASHHSHTLFSSPPFSRGLGGFPFQEAMPTGLRIPSKYHQHPLNSMRRKGNLYPQITSFENLIIAAKKAQRSKRFRHTVLDFHNNLEAEIFQLQHELRTRTYQPGTPTTFHIYEPKPRLISAAPYRDRVIHHALFKVINPIFEPTFDAYSFANRVGYGTHAALRKFTKLCRSHKYILHCDIPISPATTSSPPTADGKAYPSAISPASSSRICICQTSIDLSTAQSTLPITFATWTTSPSSATT